MNKAIDLKEKLKEYKFDEDIKSRLLKPFIIGKTNAKDKNSKDRVEIKFAVNMKDSEWLDVEIDDFGLKVIDNKSKGFCLEWDYLDNIKEINDLEIKDSDSQEENDRKEKAFDKFVEAVLNVILEEINR